MMNDNGLVWLNVKTIWKRGMRRRFHLWNVKQCKLEPEVRQDPLNLWSLVNSRRPGYISTNLSKPTWWGRGLEKVFLMLIIEMIMMLHWKVFPFLATPLISAHSGSGAHDLIRSNHNRFTSYLEDRKLGCKTIKRIFSQKEPIPKCCQPLTPRFTTIICQLIVIFIVCDDEEEKEDVAKCLYLTLIFEVNVTGLF